MCQFTLNQGNDNCTIVKTANNSIEYTFDSFLEITLQYTLYVDFLLVDHFRTFHRKYTPS